jgi:hypothetical protein
MADDMDANAQQEKHDSIFSSVDSLTWPWTVAHVTACRKCCGTTACR